MNESSMDTLMRSRFYRLGAFAYRRRVWVALGWLLAFAAMMAPLQKLTVRLSQGGFEVAGSQSYDVQRAIVNDFKARSQFTDLVVMQSKSYTANDQAFKDAIAGVVAALGKQSSVQYVANPYSSPDRNISKDGHVVTAVVGLRGTQDQVLAHDPKIEAAVATAARSIRGIDVYLTGAAPFYKAFQDTTVKDLERAEKTAFPITLVILVVAFGSLVAAGVPLVLALIGLAIAFGVISIVASMTTVSTFAQNIASMIGIGVGIDYSLFIITRFREQLNEGRTISQAVAESMASSGRAVFVSALTVVVALAGTLLVNIPAFRSMGFSAAIAVAIAGLSALTLLPAVLGFIGTGINRISVRKNKTSESRAWHRWAIAVMRRPWLALLGSLVAILVFASPALGLRIGSSGVHILPPTAGPRVAAEITGQAFGQGEIAPAEILYDDPRGVMTANGFEDLYHLTFLLAADPQVTRVDSIAGLAPGGSLSDQFDAAHSPQAQGFISQSLTRNGTRTLIEVITKGGSQDDVTTAYINRVRAQLPKMIPAGTRAWVGGGPGLNTDINHAMTSALLPVIGLVMLLTFIVLLLFFRSVLLPLKAILMNSASVLAATGVVVYVFQHGHGQGLLGFKTTGNIDAFLPLFLFCILFGLSMDYEVFMLARIREEYLRSGDNGEAVGWGLEHTAKIITSAAAIMVTVFGAFAGARLVPIKAMGFGLAFAVLLDATLIRTVLVPATMRLMGDWNWWIPRWLDRMLPRISIEEALPRAEDPAGNAPGA